LSKIGERLYVWPAGVRASLREALGAEWTKLGTLPGTPWLLAAIIAATVAVSAAASAAVSCPAGGCAVDPAKVSLTGIYLGQAVAAIVGVLAVSSGQHRDDPHHHHRDAPPGHRAHRQGGHRRLLGPGGRVMSR
jgi:hypothetical protein